MFNKNFYNNEMIIAAIAFITITKRKKIIKNKNFEYIPVYIRIKEISKYNIYNNNIKL